MTDRQLDDLLEGLRDELSVTPPPGFSASIRSRVAAASREQRRAGAIAALSLAGVILTVLCWPSGNSGPAREPGIETRSSATSALESSEPYVPVPSSQPAVARARRPGESRPHAAAPGTTGRPLPLAERAGIDGGAAWTDALQQWSAAPAPTIDEPRWTIVEVATQLPAVQVPTADPSPMVQIPVVPIPVIERSVVETTPRVSASAGWEKQQ